MNPINDASFFDVYFDLGTSHTFVLNGRVFASSEEASALATLELTGPGTNLTFSQTANLNNNGGLTNINETGTLGPGTYHLVARAEASSAVSSVPAADAEFDLDLQLTAAALTVNLASDDTSEATVQSTITIPAGQTTSAPFNIAAQTDGIVDGTQTVTITASAASHNDGTDMFDVTDVDTPAPGFTVGESDGYTLVFEDGSSDAFSVVLTTQPTANVVIDLASADVAEDEVTVSPTSLIFTPQNWDDPQSHTVTVTGVDDPTVDGDQTTLITLAINQNGTLDSAFDSLPDQTVSVITRDVDGSIRGTIWDDDDGSQTQNGGELGLPGVTVYLDLNRNGQFDGGEPTQLTAADGTYSFENVAAGEYVVAQIVPTGLAQTYPQVAGTAGTFAELVNDQSSLSVSAATRRTMSADYLSSRKTAEQSKS